MITLRKRFIPVVLSLLLSNDFQDLSFHPIVSSIAAYNYKLAKFFSELPEHCGDDSFSFCEEM